MHSLVAFTTTMLYFVPPSQGRRNQLISVGVQGSTKLVDIFGAFWGALKGYRGGAPHPYVRRP